MTIVVGKKRHAASQSGHILAETLIGLTILTLVLTPMLDLRAFISGASPIQRKIALNLANGKIEELADVYYHSNTPLQPSSKPQTVKVGQFSFSRDYQLLNYSPAANDFPQELTQLQEVMVTVQCTNCGKLSPTVKVVAVLVQVG